MSRPNTGLTGPDSKKVGVWFTPEDVTALLASANANTRTLSQEVRYRIRQSLKDRVDMAGQ